MLTEMDDRSRKGSVDSAIVELLAAVNGDSRFCSLSSCSGRIVVYRSQELRQDRPEDSGPVHDEVDATLDDIASDEVKDFAVENSFALLARQNFYIIFIAKQILTSCSISDAFVGFNGFSAQEVRKKHKKKNCDLMLVSHERVSLQQVRDSVFGGTGGEDGCRPGVITLKFEPLILHVQCSDLEAAKHLLSIRLASLGHENMVVVHIF